MTESSVTTHRPSDTDIIVQLSGSIDAAMTALLRRVLIDAIVHQRPATVLIDLREVTCLDPTAIGTIIAAADTAEDLCVNLALCKLPPDLAERLTTAELTDMSSLQAVDTVA